MGMGWDVKEEEEDAPEAACKLNVSITYVCMH